jgi:hypothetical protein
MAQIPDTFSTMELAPFSVMSNPKEINPEREGM